MQITTENKDILTNQYISGMQIYYLEAIKCFVQLRHFHESNSCKGSTDKKILQLWGFLSRVLQVNGFLGPIRNHFKIESFNEIKMFPSIFI